MYFRSQYWAACIIFLISFYLNFSLISKGPVSVDCLNLVINSQATLEDHHLHYLYGSGYPLMVLLGSIFIGIANNFGTIDPVFAVNCISVLFSSIAILVFYLLIREICHTLTAILASIILATNPIFLDVSTYGINHAPALCFLFLGLRSLLRFQTIGNITTLLLSALYFGFMGATRLQDFILLSPAVIYMFIFGLKENSPQHNKHKFRNFLSFISTLILIIILFHLPFVSFDHSNYDIQAKQYWMTGVTENFQGLFSTSLISSLSYLVLAFSAVGILCFSIGLYYTAVLNKRFTIFTILWLLIPLEFYGNTISNAPRFLTIILPAFIIPMSIYLAQMVKHKNILYKLVALTSFLIIISQTLLIAQETFIRRHSFALIPDFYRWVGKSTEPDATIISSDDKTFITYYSNRETLLKPVGIRHLSSKELKSFKKELDNILDKNKPVYITNLGFTAYDSYLEFGHLLRQNYRLIQIGQRPLELWYDTPYNPNLHMSSLVRIEKKNKNPP